MTGEVKINGIHIAIGVMDTRFMMASMGYMVGEKVTRLFEKAKKKKLPVILFCCSGGVRMQEGIISLMQMEKTAAVRWHSEAELLYVSVLTNPTMGGVTASFAMLADIILAEKGAVIGFAGATVIEQNTGQRLPEGFQTSEFQKEHGFIDEIVDRKNMRSFLLRLLKLHQNEGKKVETIR